MNALAVPSDKKNLVLHITRTLKIQAKDLVCESLPLGFLALGVKLRIGGVALVDKSEVGPDLSTTSYRQ